MATDTVFALTSGRSATRYLSELLRARVCDAVVEHEPYLRRGNPTMFGRPIYDHWAGDLDAVRRRVAQKQATIDGYRARCYIETSHAFLKSWWDVAPEFFPRMKLLHLIRHPLEVAQSEANREAFIDRGHLPMRRYRSGDGRRCFFWALTGHEPIFRSHGLPTITRFQYYLLQWIEIENRAMAFLDRFGMHDRCMTLHTPHELANALTVERLLDFLAFERKANAAVAARHQNRTPGSITRIGDDERRQCRQIVERLPDRYLDIFNRAPYVQCEWRTLLRKSSAP